MGKPAPVGGGGLNDAIGGADMDCHCATSPNGAVCSIREHPYYEQENRARTPNGGRIPVGGTPAAKSPGPRFLGRGGFLGPTEPAGRPSFLGRPTGRLILGSAFSSCFLPLPFGRPGRRFIGVPSGLVAGC